MSIDTVFTPEGEVSSQPFSAFAACQFSDLGAENFDAVVPA
jgi:hypothetical protein